MNRSPTLLKSFALLILMTLPISCQPVTELPEACGPGFEPDSTGECRTILPTETCPEGMIAIPGDATCREIAPCGESAYGDIPIDTTTQFVNAEYAGNDSDGTQSKPWLTIQQAITAAEPNGVVALAEGTYHENLLINDKPVRLWGVCPAKVSLVGDAVADPTIRIAAQLANGTEIHNVAITGAFTGLHAAGANVNIEQVWIHDTLGSGLLVSDDSKSTSVLLRQSLIENAHGFGVHVTGGTLAMEASAVRGTRMTDDGTFGDGIAAFSETSPATISISKILVESSARAGISNFGGDVKVSSSALLCNAFDIATQDFNGYDSAFFDLGQNTCGCPEARDKCHVSDASFMPPPPLP